MSETQLLTVAFSTVPTMIVVLIGILINNSRINDLNSRTGDVKDSLDARITDLKETLRAEIRVVEANMENNHSEMLHRFGDLDGRMTRIENSLGLNRG